MAELAVATAVAKLTNLIIQEAILLNGASEKVERLRNELRWMQSFLKDADHAAGHERNERLRNWVSQIREVAFDAQDVVENYIREAAAASQSLLRKAVMPIRLRKVNREIEKIQSRIEHISKQKDSFGVASIIGSRDGGEGIISTDERLRWWRQPLPHVEDDDLVDLVQDTEALLAQLASTERRRQVVSIVGMGGLGKTTLAKKLYNHIDLRHRFDCKSFVYVSKEYRRRDTLQRIIKDVNGRNIGDLEKLKEEEMVKKLHEFLKGRRYLVVLDDVWEKEVWDSLEAAFPGRGMVVAGKVMLTTRNKEVALHADARGTPHEPRMLSEDESLELFRKKALPGMDHFPYDLENLGRKMVIKCGGLPLAVVVLGGLLSRKMKSRAEWEHVLQNITWLLTDQDRVSAILALSYTDLPFYLKSCFLHLGLFPEDFSIPKTKLMRLWVAEAFLPQQGEDTAEGVAENCLNELINRCMIQVGTLTSLGRVKTIRIHDLRRDFSISMGREESFLGIYTGRGVESSLPPSTKSRRLSVHLNREWCCPFVNSSFLNPYAPHLRSLHFFNAFEYPERYFMKKDLKLLKVLDLNDAHGFVKVPSAIGILTQLRYLELSQAVKNCYTPPSIGNLKNLETLDLGWCFSHIPNVIWKMKCLRHLLLRDKSPPNGGKLRLDTLRHLQTLKSLGAGRWIEDGGLVNMISLRRLGIQRLSPEKVNLVILILERLRCLQSLSLTVMKGETFPALGGLSNCGHLRKLCLKGKIDKLHDLHEFPSNLVKLSLIGSDLQKDSIVQLERLPYLKMLVLGPQSYRWRELVCSAQGFPQLQVLHLSLIDLEAWTVEENAMIKLKHLKIENCPQLKEIPERLTALEKFEKVAEDTDASD